MSEQVTYPLERDIAGNHAWSSMHHRVSLYPDSPTQKDKDNMKIFLYESMKSVALLCKNCKSHIKDYLRKNPIEPALESKQKLSLFLCDFHNHVNSTNGKEVKDCTKILRSKQEECKDCNVKVTKQDTPTSLKDSFEKFKEASVKVFYALCDKYKVPYPVIKFHECPSNPLNSCTSMWLDTVTSDIVEKPIVYLHPNVFGLRTITHEFIHYLKQLSKDTMGGLDEESVERDAQMILNQEFPFDTIEKSDLRSPIKTTQVIVRNDTPSKLQEFPNAYRIYNKYLYNIKRRDFHPPGEEQQGDWILGPKIETITQPGMGGIEEPTTFFPPQQKEDKKTNALSFLDGIYSPIASLFGMDAADVNLYNTPNIISNATLSIMKTYLSPIGAVLLTGLTSLGILGGLALSKNSLSYGDKLLMQAFGSNFLWSTLDYVRPGNKEEVMDEALLLGNVIAAQQYNLIPQVLLGDELMGVFGGAADVVSQSPQTVARNAQRAANAASNPTGGGGNTIKRASIDRRQEAADLKEFQKEVAANTMMNPTTIKDFRTGAGMGSNRADVRRGSVNSVTYTNDDVVVIPSDMEEYESSFGMHVADGGASSYAVDYSGDVSGRNRNTIKDIFGTDTYYDNFNDVYYEGGEYYG